MLPFYEFYLGEIKLSVPMYTLFSCIGAAFAMIIIYNRIAKIDGITFKKYLFLILLMVIGVALGSKLLFIITIIPDIVNNWSLQYAFNRIVTAGFVFYGGLTGAIVGIYVFSKVCKIRFKTISNVVCPALPAFHAFGRIGCLFAGCCYGKAISAGFYHLYSESDISRIPIQLIESAFLVVITILIFIIDKKKKYEIPLLLIYLIIYAVGRFIIEFFRGDTLRGIWLGLSTSQWVARAYFMVSIMIIYKNKIRERIFEQ